MRKYDDVFILVVMHGKPRKLKFAATFANGDIVRVRKRIDDFLGNGKDCLTDRR